MSGVSESTSIEPRTLGERATGAFTLVELLTVTAILATLMAILLPSLHHATVLVRNVACTANLRTIGFAWHLYLEDNNDQFPLRRQNMQWFYGGKHPSICNDLMPRFALPFRPLNPYADKAMQNMSSAEEFHCPADREIRSRDDTYSLTGGRDAYDHFGNSYMMNNALLSGWRTTGKYAIPTGWAFRLSYVEVHFSRLVVAGDCQWYYTINDFPWNAEFHNSNDKMNMLFLDGRAEFMQMERGKSSGNDYVFWPYRPND